MLKWLVVGILLGQSPPGHQMAMLRMRALLVSLCMGALVIPAAWVSEPSPVRAQWSGDPAQNGATSYCDAINAGRSRAEAEAAAVQLMMQLLALAQGSLVIQQPFLPPSVQERWGALVQERCPLIGGMGEVAGDDR